MEFRNLTSAIESMLFAADRPLTLSRLREVLVDTPSDAEAMPTEADIKERIALIQAKYANEDSGFELREAQGGWHFTTKVENAQVIQKFLATKPFRLGRSSLEAMAIIAYRQPITRAEIDAVRGIDSSHLLRLLMERGLVRMVGKAEIPGRPVTYGTTPKFLETLGLASVADLPPLSELEQIQGDTEDPMKTLEAGLDRFVSETDRAEEIQAQATEGLAEISGLIESAIRPDEEVYDSQEAAEVARENRDALAAFQAATPRRRRKSVSFEDLSAAPLPPMDEPPPGDMGPSAIN